MEANLGRLLLDAYRWVDAALLEGLEDRLGIRLTSAQSQLFAEISLRGSRQSDLARVLGVSRQAVNELVRGLEAAGMVEVVPDPDSGRSKLVRPTELGAESIEVALGVFSDVEQALAARIGDETLAAMRAGLAADWGDPATAPTAETRRSGPNL